MERIECAAVGDPSINTNSVQAIRESADVRVSRVLMFLPAHMRCKTNKPIRPLVSATVPNEEAPSRPHWDYTSNTQETQNSCITLHTSNQSLPTRDYNTAPPAPDLLRPHHANQHNRPNAPSSLPFPSGPMRRVLVGGWGL
jgi:hypothetical protein